MHAEQLKLRWNDGGGDDVSYDAAQLEWRALIQARERANDRLDALAQDLADVVIAEHLRPAFVEVMTVAREQADVLGDQPLDVMSLMSAPTAVRDAYAWLVKLEARMTQLRQARVWVNSAGYRTS